MSGPRTVATRMAREERGGVLVFFMVSMPVMLLLMSFVIDVGNWFEHRRHLQLQADAAALAAAGDIVPCGDAPARVAARIEEYGKTRNPQVGGTPSERVQWKLNSRTWPWQDGGKVDDTVVEGTPCQARMIDVKMTERDLPWWLQATRKVDFINVQARVSFFGVTTLGTGALPVAVPDTNPSAVRVWFVDESTSPPTTIPNSSRTLALRKTASGAPVIENGLQLWDNAMDNGGTPLPLAVSSARVGMRVAIIQDASTTECGQPLVHCYDATSANGLLFLRGHTPSAPLASGAAPELRDAWLLPGSCGDGYFSRLGVACGVQLSAKVDFASGATATQPRVFAIAGGREYTMSLDTAGTATTADDYWKTAATAIPVASGGSVQVDVRVEQRSGAVGTTTCTNNPPEACKRTFTHVQRHVSASDARSGPIRKLVVSKGLATHTNSLERCTPTRTSCTHDVTVSVGVLAGVQGTATAGSPPVSLRVAGGGSQNQSLDCDPDVSNLKDEIAAGCEPSYTINPAETCPAGNQELWALPQPWKCVGIQTGAAINQVPAGMNLRVLGSEQAKTCTAPNRWPEVLTNPDLLADDPRLVAVFITPYNSFGGSGSGTVPVRNFAYFYVTGWAGSGGGFNNPCEAMGDDTALPGEITGHFVKYVNRLNDGSGGTTPCDFDSATPCVAQMTD